MPVIRKEEATAQSLFSFRDVESEATQIIAAAKAESAQIIEAARQTALREAEQIRATAQQEGYQTGQEQGTTEARQSVTETATAEAREQTKTLFAALERLHAQLQQQRHSLLAESERGLVQLALGVAARVCRHPRLQDAAGTEANVAALLELVGPRHDLVIELNPSDLELLGTIEPVWLQSEHPPRLEPNETLAPGDCLLRTPDGTIDATIATQLDRIAEALLGETNTEDAE